MLISVVRALEVFEDQHFGREDKQEGQKQSLNYAVVLEMGSDVPLENWEAGMALLYCIKSAMDLTLYHILPLIITNSC